MKLVGIIEDNVEMRATIQDYLTIIGGYEVCFSIGSLAELEAVDKRLDPQLIFLDIYLTDINGIEIIGLIKRIFINAAVVVVTGNTFDSQNLSKAVERGASSFLFKPFSIDQLSEIAERLNNVPAYLLPSVANKLVLMMHQKYTLATRLGMSITPMEENIVALLLDGRTRKEIAEDLNVSLSLVNATITRLIHKAGCDNVKSLILLLREVIFQKTSAMN